MERGVPRTIRVPGTTSLSGVPVLVAVTVKAYVASSIPAQSGGTARLMPVEVERQGPTVGALAASVTQAGGMAVGSARYVRPKSMAVKERPIVSGTFPPFSKPTVYVAVFPGSTSLSRTRSDASGSPKGSTVRVAVMLIAIALFVVLRAVRVTTRGPGEVVHARTGVS